MHRLTRHEVLESATVLGGWLMDVLDVVFRNRCFRTVRQSAVDQGHPKDGTVGADRYVLLRFPFIGQQGIFAVGFIFERYLEVTRIPPVAGEGLLDF